MEGEIVTLVCVYLPSFPPPTVTHLYAQEHQSLGSPEVGNGLIFLWAEDWCMVGTAVATRDNDSGTMSVNIYMVQNVYSDTS